MSASQSFRVDGPAIPKARARCSANGRFYTPSRTTDYEQLVAWTAKAAGIRPQPGPLGLRITFFRVRAKTSKALHPIGRPDVDNCAKAILDALNQVAYQDDAQIVDLQAIKRYGHDEHTLVEIWPVP